MSFSKMILSDMAHLHSVHASSHLEHRFQFVNEFLRSAGRKPHRKDMERCTGVNQRDEKAPGPKREPTVRRLLQETTPAVAAAARREATLQPVGAVFEECY